MIRLGLICCASLLVATESAAVEIVAHRGASWDAPENTLAAFQLAWQRDADAVELDLHLSQDGQIVVIHDADTKRVSGVEGKVVQQSFAELRMLDVGRWKDPRFAGERIPVFDDVLASIPDGKRLFIEIKVGPDILSPLEDSLRRSGKANEQLVIIAFDYETLRQSKQRFPDLQHYWLLSYRRDRDSGQYPDLDEAILQAGRANFDGLNLNENWPIDAEFTSKVKAAGLGLYVWTVNDPQTAQRLAAAGVDGITTDRPAWLREQVSSR